MESNAAIIHSFYTALKSKEFESLKLLYSEQLIFSDEVFNDLHYEQTIAMWTMLLSRSTDIKIEFGEVKATEQSGTAVWQAQYTFSPTGRKVVNIIHANFKFGEGKIIHHVDHFNFYAWARQAFGWKGVLLGWMPFFRKKVQRSARKSLENFMRKIG
ncbi:MAG: nuclear transport factor 2 family protein [Saprospiraceae bacterium]|nr:nuclear transport factor 2 family protein [Candidatus Vicinibacter affinis]